MARKSSNGKRRSECLPEGKGEQQLKKRRIDEILGNSQETQDNKTDLSAVTARNWDTPLLRIPKEIRERIWDKVVPSANFEMRPEKYRIADLDMFMYMAVYHVKNPENVTDQTVGKKPRMFSFGKKWDQLEEIQKQIILSKRTERISQMKKKPISSILLTCTQFHREISQMIRRKDRFIMRFSEWEHQNSALELLDCMSEAEQSRIQWLSISTFTTWSNELQRVGTRVSRLPLKCLDLQFSTWLGTCTCQCFWKVLNDAEAEWIREAVRIFRLEQANASGIKSKLIMLHSGDAVPDRFMHHQLVVGGVPGVDISCGAGPLSRIWGGAEGWRKMTDWEAVVPTLVSSSVLCQRLLWSLRNALDVSEL
ncbi:hypothetical protein MMC20_005760 [Loxospora ochrophaea]|nr:hypothetical protein [Loxospora ochrophaea]